jgi:hypothetical protein
MGAGFTNVLTARLTEEATLFVASTVAATALFTGIFSCLAQKYFPQSPQ